MSLDALLLDGMRFAAIHWDGVRLIASRDPIGLAPLFYRFVEGAVWLSTEVGPLLCLGPSAPDLEALSARAAFVPLDERTGWVGIHRVLPGSTLEIEVPGLAIRSTPYWRPESRFGTYRGNYADALSEFRARFGAAVNRCFEPGSAILLSGGVDSAAVAVTARANTGAASHLVHAHFSALPKTDERQYASAVASVVGLPLHVVSGLTAPWDICAELDTHGIPYNWLPYGMDEPILGHLAARKIGVALDGHDGDGVLGAPGGAVWGSLVFSGELRRVAAYAWRDGAKRAVRGIAADFVPPGFRPQRFRSPTYMDLVAPYLREPLRSRSLRDDIFRWGWPVNRWKRRQLQPLLPRAVISFEQKEIEAARAGIDLRHPFADRKLVEFLVSLPVSIKSDPGRAKPLLVDALGDMLPEVIYTRRKSDYMASVRERVEPRWCIDKVCASKIRLPHVEYTRLFEDRESHPEKLPLFFLVNLARVHEFARQACDLQHGLVNGRRHVGAV